MCRILITDSLTFLNSAKDTLKLGGPDDQNRYNENGVIYYHTRLSIQGLGLVGKQPVIKNNIILLFNGEIYNKTFLEKKYFSSKKYESDTYLVFDLISEFGYEVIDDFEGMFSIVWKNTDSNYFFIARDVFGKKPLYIKNSISDWFISSQYDWYNSSESCSEIFKIFGFYPEPFTAFDDVSVIPSGTVQKFIPGKKLETIHRISVRNNRCNLSEALISDVPVALAYSGGVDSSVLSELYKNKVDNLCIGSLPDYAKKPLHKIILSKNEYKKYMTRWKSLKGSMHSIDGFNTFVLTDICKKKEYKVVVSGVGGDEMFSGYKQHRYYLLILMISFLPKLIIKQLSKSNGRLGRLDWLLTNKLPRKFKVYLAIRSISKLENIYFNNKLINKLTCIYNFRSKLFKRLNIERVYANLEMSIFLKSRLLRDSDYFSMMNGIEVRAPFLNKGLLTKINENIILNSVFLPNKLGSIIFFKKYNLLKIPFYKKEGFFINFGKNKNKSLLDEEGNIC
jgi:asparagine synthase (glutamine-hydrolysing)